MFEAGDPKIGVLVLTLVRQFLFLRQSMTALCVSGACGAGCSVVQPLRNKKDAKSARRHARHL